MSIVAIIAALVIEQWRPLGHRPAVQGTLGAWAAWLEQSFNGGERHHGVMAWLVAVLPPVALALALHLALYALQGLLALAFKFAVVGAFEDAVYCWRTQARTWLDPNAGIVLAGGAGAMGVRLGMPVQDVEGMQPRPELGLGEPAEGPFLDSTVGLLWRAVVVWVFVLALLTVARLL